MSRISGTFRNRRRPRQSSAEGGPSRARSIAPVILLGTCMAAVLYGNATYYSDSLQGHQSLDTSTSAGPPEFEYHKGAELVGENPAGAGAAKGGGEAEGEADVGGAGGGDGKGGATAAVVATEKPSEKSPLPEEGQLPEPPAAIAAQGDERSEVAVADGEGGLQERWDDDNAGREEGEEDAGGGGGGGGAQSLTVGGEAVAALGAGSDGAGGLGGMVEMDHAAAGASTGETTKGLVSEAEKAAAADARAPSEGGGQEGQEGESSPGPVGGEGGGDESRGGNTEVREGEGGSEGGSAAAHGASSEAEVSGGDNGVVVTAEGGGEGVGGGGGGGGGEGGALEKDGSASLDAELKAAFSEDREKKTVAAAPATMIVQQRLEEEVEEDGQGQQPTAGTPAVLVQPGDVREQPQPQQPQQQQQQPLLQEEEEGTPETKTPGGLRQPGDGGADAGSSKTQPLFTSPFASKPGAQVDGDAGGNTGPKDGAVQGSMQCATTKLGEGADSIVNIATWKDVPGDAAYRNPLAEANEGRYVTLQKDLGGFNNIRLSLESGVAFAAATGRTFVIPPPFPIWNMNDKERRKEVDLRNLLSFEKLRASGRVSIITTEEFLQREAYTGNLGIQPNEGVQRLSVSAITQYMVEVAGQYGAGLPQLHVEKSGFVMPRRINDRVDLEDESYAFAKKWLYGRELLEYRDAWEEAKVIHFRASEARLLTPFYAFLLHSDEASERYYNRLMRDMLHYPEEVYCKASQIISLLRKEDPSGDFSTFHVRRNDFGKFYAMLNIDVAAVIANSLDHLKDNEVVYVATDEKDLTLFEPFKKYTRVKFLSDYYERAGVSELNPNLLGMLDQIIASHGRTFTGCWLSTFSAYILRLRGHLQKPRTSNFSYYLPRKTYHHQYKMPENPLWMTEWPLGWEGIDETATPDSMVP